ncbi:MAG: B12-binding domain-containing protein [Promethearchaeota archaeon]
MHSIYEEFLEYLDNENKEKCVKFVISKLESKELDILTLYSEILQPALNRFYCNLDEDKLCIWREQVRASIIRTIIELCYPYILKEREVKGITSLKIQVFVGCPAEEYCDTGARMIADIFILYGFDAIFVGANIPRDEIRDLINTLKPKIIAISITNYYNLIEAEKAISLIRNYTKFDGIIVVEGVAFLSNPEVYKKIGADIYLENYSQIKLLAKEV